MTEVAPVGQPVRMPKTVVVAVVGLWLHTIVNLYVTVNVLLAAKSMADHNREHAGSYAIVAGGIAIVITGLFGLASVAVMRGRLWGRELAYFLELLSLIICGFLLVLSIGIAELDPTASLQRDVVAVGGVLWVLLPIVVVGCLAGRPAKRWLERPPH